MRLNVYKRISGIASKIHSQILNQLAPGERIPSESRISEQIGESYNRVHRAMRMLIKDGIVSSLPDHKGMIYTPHLSVISKKKKPHTILKIALLEENSCPQTTIMLHVCDLFQMLDSSVEIQITSPDEEADLYFNSLPIIDCSRYREIDITKLEPVSGMVKDVVKAGIQYGKQYGLPILHAPAVYWGHWNMLKKAGLSPKEFQDPMDYVRWGIQLEEKANCTSGYYFYSTIYHLSQWGIEKQKKDGYYHFQPDRLRKFFTDMYLYGKPNIHRSGIENIKMFRRGLLGLQASFLNVIHQSEKRFCLLGQPVREKGFSSQAIFFMAIGKNTREEVLCYDFLKFMLTDHIQELFFRPYTNFSVIDRIYKKQHQILSRKTEVIIPPFDLRGAPTDLGLWAYIQPYLSHVVYDFFDGQISMESAIRKFSKVREKDHQEEWLQNMSDQHRKQFAYFIKMLEKGEV